MGVVLLAMVMWSSFGRVYAAEFEVEGIAVDDVFHGDAIETSVTNQFFVAFRNGEYLIRTWAAGASNYIECAWDGNVLRTVVADYRATTNASGVWLNAGTVETQIVPTAQFPFLPALWLAYCSSDYFKAAKDHTVQPVWPQDNPLLRQQGFRVKAEWTLAEADPHVPELVTFLNDGRYRGFDKESQRPIEIPLPPPYGAGFTNAIYRANVTTNLNSLSLPIEFFLRQYRTPLGAGVTAGMPRYTILGYAREVRSRATVGAYYPAFHGSATVCDYRFAQKLPAGRFHDDGYVQYKATRGTWPSGEDLESQVYSYTRSAAIMQGMQAASLAQPGRSRIWVRIMILLVACSPLPVLLGRMLRAMQTTRNSTKPETRKE
jgi:hypothetical protein